MEKNDTRENPICSRRWCDTTLFIYYFTPHSIDSPADSPDIDIPDSLSSGLEHPKPEGRIRTIKILEKLAKDANGQSSIYARGVRFLDLPYFLDDFRKAVELSMPELVKLAVNDENKDVRDCGVKALKTLVPKGVLN